MTLGVKSQSRFAKVMHAGMTDFAAHRGDLVNARPVPHDGAAIVIRGADLVYTGITIRIKSQAGFTQVVDTGCYHGMRPNRCVAVFEAVGENRGCWIYRCCRSFLAGPLTGDRNPIPLFP